MIVYISQQLYKEKFVVTIMEMSKPLGRCNYFCLKSSALSLLAVDEKERECIGGAVSLPSREPNAYGGRIDLVSAALTCGVK